MTKTRGVVVGVGIAGLVGAGALALLPAQAAPGDPIPVVQTESCHDGGGVLWTGKVTWIGPYSDAKGKTRIRVDRAEWTTAVDVESGDPIPTDSKVKTYQPALVQTLTRTADTDYALGTVTDGRNPRNPLSAPGKSRITIQVGVDGDGFGDCLMTFFQPLSFGAEPTPSPTPSETVTPSETPSETVTPSETPSDTPSETVTPSETPSETVTPSESATP